MWEFWRGKLSSGQRGSPRVARVSSPRSARPAPTVNFKDLNLSVDDELDTDELEEACARMGDEDATNKRAIMTRSVSRGAQKSKLVIIMVGLPGRGKTFLCNKLKCYLNWLGHPTAHFNVGHYRRLQKGADEVQDAAFFDNNNKAGRDARQRALQGALADVLGYLAGDGQVAIFDATNSTRERRSALIDTFHGKFQYLFIESVCTDSQVLERNYRYKMAYSPDYQIGLKSPGAGDAEQGVDMEAALADFKARIAKYNQVYEPIDDRALHYIKLIDMVTGRGYMDVNRISGYIPGKIVFFLMQVCKAGMTTAQSRKIWLTRHGESEYNVQARIGGDSALSPRGEEYARLLPEVLESRLPAPGSPHQEGGVPVSVWTSTLRRSIQTANYLPYPKLRWKALDEIHAGVCDGMTYSQIATELPEDYDARKKDKLRYRYPSGESYLDVIQRLEPVIIEIEREKEYVAIVGHQAILRAIYGYFMSVPLEEIPRLDIPLHTLIELQPRPDGTMGVQVIPVPVAPPRSVPERGFAHSDSGDGSGSLLSFHARTISANTGLPSLGASPVQGAMLARAAAAAAAASASASAGGAPPGAAQQQQQQQQQQQASASSPAVTDSSSLGVSPLC